MRRKALMILMAVAMVLFLFSCGTAPNENKEKEISSPSSNKLYTDRRITKAQMLLDYDAMWKTMKESYPFWGVLARSKPDDPDYYEGVIADYRRQIEGIKTEGDEAMYSFLYAVACSLYDVCGMTGHVSIINPNYFRDLDVYKKFLGEMPEVQPWVDTISRPEVIAFYEYYGYLMTLPLESADNDEGSAEEDVQQETSKTPPANLTTEILENGKTAYIRVDSFDDSFIEADLPQIRAFLEKVKDYSHLIIDIKENDGGNTVYWEDAFVRPNIAEPINSRLVRLMKNDELSQKFYGADYISSMLDIQDIKSDPKFTQLPLEDISDYFLSREISVAIEPETDKKMFNGRIWVLTGPGVYSSAEAFAVFCKDTGFATLVGQTTGGSDSGGPILYELPNSHLLIQFDVEYCLNADGSCNQEMGTVPDIESDDPLQTVLNLIDKQ